MELTDAKRAEFARDVRSILQLQECERLSSRALEARMRAMNWKGWRDLGAFVRLCRNNGFYGYNGLNRQRQTTHFVAMSIAPAKEPDSFKGVGYVVAVTDGEWVNRSRPVKTTKFRANARVWTTRGGVLGYCERLGHDFSCIESTKVLDGAPA